MPSLWVGQHMAGVLGLRAEVLGLKVEADVKAAGGGRVGPAKGERVGCTGMG